jgi:hypothetical protein
MMLRQRKCIRRDWLRLGFLSSKAQACHLNCFLHSASESSSFFIEASLRVGTFVLNITSSKQATITDSCCALASRFCDHT